MFRQITFMENFSPDGWTRGCEHHIQHPHTFIWKRIRRNVLCSCARGIRKAPFPLRKSARGRGSKIRTHNKGFGDPRVTITPCPYVLSNVYYYIPFSSGCQYPNCNSGALFLQKRADSRLRLSARIRAALPRSIGSVGRSVRPVHRPPAGR